ncbi:MAG: diacylglycerol/lipid kinase family protein [Armatimonadota bacterium]
MRRALLIINPQARAVEHPSAICGVAQRLLADHGVRSSVYFAPDEAAATRAARQASKHAFDVVVAVGGDGVANRVAQGLAGTTLPLGHIPLGTGNSLAWQLGLRPGDLRQACAVIAAGNTHTIDLGLANGRAFIGQADLGLGALVQRQVSSRWKGRLGVLALVNRFLKTLPRARPWEYRMRVEGEERQGTMWGVFALNLRRQVWRVRLDLPGTDHDGMLQALVLRGCSRRRLVSIASLVALRDVNLARIPEIEVFAANALELETCPPALWEVDGEVEEPAPLSLRVHRHGLRLVVPVGYQTESSPRSDFQVASNSVNLETCPT